MFEYASIESITHYMVNKPVQLKYACFVEWISSYKFFNLYNTQIAKAFNLSTILAITVILTCIILTCSSIHYPRLYVAICKSGKEMDVKYRLIHLHCKCGCLFLK